MLYHVEFTLYAKRRELNIYLNSLIGLMSSSHQLIIQQYTRMLPIISKSVKHQLLGRKYTGEIRSILFISYNLNPANIWRGYPAICTASIKN